MSLLIVDGIIATGKTSLVAQLQTEPEFLERPTKLVISEHITERVLEGRSPTTDDRVALLKTTLSSIESLHRIIQESKFAGLAKYAPCVILERFHLTHAANDRHLGPYMALDEVLANLNAHLAFLYHSEEALEERIEETRRQRGEHWCTYLDGFGGRQGALDHFRRLQERSWELYSCSVLPKVAFEARGQSIVALSRQVTASWLRGGNTAHAEPPCEPTIRATT